MTVEKRSVVARTAAPAREQQHRYLLAQWTADRREDGWYIAKSSAVAHGEKPRWEGPYPYPEDAAIAIARYLCAELSNRHMSRAKYHKIEVGSPYYGLPKPPNLASSRKQNGVRR